MATWAKGVDCTTLFIEDLDRTKEFYTRVFGVAVHYEDSTSVVFHLGDTMINLITMDSAKGLIAPATASTADHGSQFQFTITVDDVDAVCVDLAGRGVTLLNGPMERPWGVRTASFVDPDGHIFEVAT